MTCRRNPSAIGWTCKKRSPRTSRVRTSVPALLAIYSGACKRKTRHLAPTSPTGCKRKTRHLTRHHAQTAMATFIDGLERGTLLRHKLKRLQDNHHLDLSQMIQSASEFAAATDDARGSLPATAVPTQARRNSSTKRKTAP